MQDVSSQSKLYVSKSKASKLQAVHGAAASMLRNLSKQLKLAIVVTKHCFKSLSAGTPLDLPVK